MNSNEDPPVVAVGKLSLAEEILLLSLFEKKDSVRVPSSLSLPYLLAGAVLVELVLSGGAKLSDGWLVPCADPEQFADEALRFSLARICQRQKDKKLEHWVYLLGAKGKPVMKSILLSLVDRGTLVKEGSSYTWPEARQDGTPLKYPLKREIRDAVFSQQPVTDRILARLVLLEACDMLDHLFTKDEIISARKKVKQLKSGKDFSADLLHLLIRMADAVKYAVAAAITT